MHAASRSLASYFDDTSGGSGGAGVSTDWHDQMEEASAHVTVKSLGSWMYHPDHVKPVWVPESANGDPYKKPPGVPYQEKPGKDEQWNPAAWGRDDYIVKSTPKPKSEAPKKREKLSPEQQAQAKLVRASEKATKRKYQSDTVKQLHASCYTILMRNSAWDLLDTTGQRATHAEYILNDIARLQGLVSTQIQSRKAALKEKGGNHKSREITLHEETTHVITKTAWYGNRGWFAAIDNFCTVYGLTNTLGMQLPDEAEDGGLYLSTASLLLSKAKEVIMDGILHIKAKKAKNSRLDQDECDFVNLSYQAKTLLNKIRGKDKPPRAPKKDLPDNVQVEKWKKHIREMEAAFFMEKHPGVAVPKHLQDRPPPKPQGPGKKKKEGAARGGGGHGNSKKEAEEFESFKRFEAFKAQQHAHHKQHHHNAITPSINPPKGNPDAVPGPTRPPAGGRGRRPNMVPPPPERTGSYMPGYTYYCD